jgi:ATP-dependent DNA helicase RecG
MPLPINIKQLLTGHVVEWDRLEFKEGWNPQETIQTICAFANDFHNWGGGYLVIGIHEENGKPVLPPKGISAETADTIQKKLIEYSHKIIPNYHPICEPCTIEAKLILVIWVPAGELRHYKAPVSIFKNPHDYAYFIRINANTVRAKGQTEQELLTLANKVPFDDRQNHHASITDLNPALIQGHLHAIGSELATLALEKPIEELGRKMQIIRGVPEAPRPLNIGLLFFNEDPSQWFPQTQIDIVHMPHGPGGDVLVEKIFSGPLSSMLKNALDYLKNQVITQQVIKHPDKAEAERFYNVPYAALEEALVNAVYHRSYEEREPIEVRITPQEITILSFPGPDTTIRMEDLQAGQAIARRYRNRRIGEFLKELELSEGRGTGIPKILNAMQINGSSQPTFESDPQRISLLVRLPLRAILTTTNENKNKVSDQVSDQQRDQVKVLHFCLHPESLSDILTFINRSNRTKFRDQVITPLINKGLLAMTHPELPTHRSQKYFTTQKGNATL